MQAAAAATDGARVQIPVACSCSPYWAWAGPAGRYLWVKPLRPWLSQWPTGGPGPCPLSLSLALSRRDGGEAKRRPPIRTHARTPARPPARTAQRASKARSVARRSSVTVCGLSVAVAVGDDRLHPGVCSTPQSLLTRLLACLFFPYFLRARSRSAAMRANADDAHQNMVALCFRDRLWAGGTTSDSKSLVVRRHTRPMVQDLAFRASIRSGFPLAIHPYASSEWAGSYTLLPRRRRMIRTLVVRYSPRRLLLLFSSARTRREYDVGKRVAMYIAGSNLRGRTGPTAHPDRGSMHDPSGMRSIPCFLHLLLDEAATGWRSRGWGERPRDYYMDSTSPKLPKVPPNCGMPLGNIPVAAPIRGTKIRKTILAPEGTKAGPDAVLRPPPPRLAASFSSIVCASLKAWSWVFVIHPPLASLGVSPPLSFALAATGPGGPWQVDGGRMSEGRKLAAGPRIESALRHGLRQWTCTILYPGCRAQAMV